MYAVTKVIHFCYGHRLLNYQGKCRHLHGHNGTVEIELSAAALDRLGMVRDFTEIKQTIQGWIDAELDHKMILCREDPVLPLLRQLKEPLYVIAENPTAENLAKLIYGQVKRLGFPVRSVRLWETDSSFAVYRPDALNRTRALPVRRRRTTSRRVRSMSTAA